MLKVNVISGKNHKQQVIVLTVNLVIFVGSMVVEITCCLQKL